MRQSVQAVFLDNSRALGVYGSEAEVYRKLRESFEKDSLEANENTGRACHWHYGYVENDYPTAEIIPDEKPEKKDSQHDKSDDSSVEKKADAGTSSSPSGKNSLKMDVTSGQDSLSDEAEAEKTSSELSAEKTAVPSVTDTSDDSVPSPNPALGSGPVSETNYDDTIVGKGKDQDLSEQSEEEPALTDSVDTGGKAGGRPLSDKTLSVSGHTADVDKTKAKPGAPGNKEVWVPGDSCSTPVVTGQVAGETLVKIPAIGTCPVKKVTIGGTEAMGGRVTPTVPESTHGKTGTKKGGGLSAVRKFDSEMAA